MTYPNDFSKWTTQMVEDIFGIQKVKNNNSLSEWLLLDEPLTETEHSQIENRRQFAENRISLWSLSDIKFKFLGPLMQIAELDTQKLHLTPSIKLVRF